MRSFGVIFVVGLINPLNKHSSSRWCEAPLCAYMWYVTSLYQVQYYSDVIMGAMASQITGVSIVYLIVSSGADRRKHQSSASLAFVRGIHRWAVNFLHKGAVTRKMFPHHGLLQLGSRYTDPIWFVTMPKTGHRGHDRDSGENDPLNTTTNSSKSLCAQLQQPQLRPSKMETDENGGCKQSAIVSKIGGWQIPFWCRRLSESRTI